MLMLNIIPTDNELDEIVNNLKSQNNNTNNKFSPDTKDFYYENDTNFISKILADAEKELSKDNLDDQKIFLLNHKIEVLKSLSLN